MHFANIKWVFVNKQAQNQEIINILQYKNLKQEIINILESIWIIVAI